MKMRHVPPGGNLGREARKDCLSYALARHRNLCSGGCQAVVAAPAEPAPARRCAGGWRPRNFPPALNGGPSPRKRNDASWPQPIGAKRTHAANSGQRAQAAATGGIGAILHRERVYASTPDVAEAITQGDKTAEAAAMAEDGLVSTLSFYIDAGEALPRPSPADHRPVAIVPPLVAAKLALHEIFALIFDRREGALLH